MRARIDITTPVTTLVLADESHLGEVVAASKVEPAALRTYATEGRAFFVATDDPVRYALELFVDEPVPPSIEEEYATRSGVFFLRLPSGRLAATEMDGVAKADSPPSPVKTIALPAGNYLLTVLDRTVPNIRVHDARLRDLLGDADWRYSQRLNWLGAGGCLATIAGAAFALVALVRRAVWFLIPVLLLPELLYLLLTRLPRYRRIEAKRRDYEQSLPQYLLVLRPTEIRDEVAGGWVDAR